MIYFIVALICLTLGLYAGKRRAKGEGWCQILCDLFYDLCGAIRAIWVRLTNPFLAEPAVAETNGETK